MPQVRRDFEQGTLNYSERLTIPGFGTNGILYWLNQNPEFEKVVRDFEERTGSVVYHATHEVFEGIGRILDLFYVSKYEEEWPQDRVDLEDGYSMVYAANLDVDWMSEYGVIGFETRGGMVRNAWLAEPICERGSLPPKGAGLGQFRRSGYAITVTARNFSCNRANRKDVYV